MENLINEFTSKIYPGETISSKEYSYFKEAISYMGFEYQRRKTKLGFYLYDFIG